MSWRHINTVYRNEMYVCTCSCFLFHRTMSGKVLVRWKIKIVVVRGRELHKVSWKSIWIICLDTFIQNSISWIRKSSYYRVIQVILHCVNTVKGRFHIKQVFSCVVCHNSRDRLHAFAYIGQWRLPAEREWESTGNFNRTNTHKHDHTHTKT